jgi:hypothetical protein
MTMTRAMGSERDEIATADLRVAAASVSDAGPPASSLVAEAAMHDHEKYDRRVEPPRARRVRRQAARVCLRVPDPAGVTPVRWTALSGHRAASLHGSVPRPRALVPRSVWEPFDQPEKLVVSLPEQ